jgi:predicted outer membrane repeat protein
VAGRVALRARAKLARAWRAATHRRTRLTRVLLVCLSAACCAHRAPRLQVVFRGNTAANGGALFTQSGVAATLDGDANAMTGNSATQRGGAVYVVSGSTLNITGKLAATGNTASPVGDSASGGGWAYVEVAATLNIACPGDVSLTNNQPDAVRAELFRPDFTGSCDACHGDISNAGACACRRAAKRLCAQHPLLRCVCSCPPLACRRCARCAPTSHRSLRAHRRWLGWLRTAGLVFHFGPGVRLQRRLRGRHQRQLHGLR